VLATGPHSAAPRARGPEAQLAADNERLRRQLAALTEAKAAAINDDNVRLLAALEQARARAPRAAPGPPRARRPMPHARAPGQLDPDPRAQENAELEAECRRLVARLARPGDAGADAARDGLLAANDRLTAAKQRVRALPRPAGRACRWRRVTSPWPPERAGAGDRGGARRQEHAAGAGE